MVQQKHPLVQAADTARRLDAEQQFLATLTDVQGGTGQIVRNDGRNEPDGQYYAIAGSYLARGPQPCDTVLVMRVGGGYLIKDDIPAAGG